MIDNQQVGRNMMMLRLQKGLSQQGLAELCNVTHQAVSKWENGAALPDMQTMLFLSKFYGVSMEDILAGSISMDTEGREEKTQPAASPTQEASSSLEDSIQGMNRQQIIALAPFASSETLEVLVERCTETMDESMLYSLAPFLSSGYLDELARKLHHVNPELVIGLAPFLSKETLDWLILGGQTG